MGRGVHGGWDDFIQSGHSKVASLVCRFSKKLLLVFSSKTGSLFEQIFSLEIVGKIVTGALSCPLLTLLFLNQSAMLLHYFV